ncbi:MAG: F0F1 ATP synthase subunit B [Limnochordaceae bacterium]|uniref:ATP synthase subunit b n=1 Tax=Carboxydichorda subterranea TaxID=3109565 RepID=A0ABZ1BVX0_9FIRM|nr:F0F1 ATP synthase subunit B [Limnochorda sp. L945t]MBE3599454.1 F0F1 ATP synthase subunit B [Limnochordaceae bacterium]WRP16931.1 F0F1 ATP synthase subunit B [Limnochorda sp. L945t]
MEWAASSAMFLAAAEGAAQTPLQFNVVTFLAQVINVLIVLYLLTRFLFKPLGEVLQKREAEVSESLDGARQARAEAEKLRDEMRASLEEARRRAQQELQRALEAAEQERQRRLKLAEEETRRMLEQARAEIRMEREQAVAAIRDEAAALAVDAAQHLLRRNISDDDQRRLAREFIEQVGERR